MERIVQYFGIGRPLDATAEKVCEAFDGTQSSMDVVHLFSDASGSKNRPFVDVFRQDRYAGTGGSMAKTVRVRLCA